MPLDRVQVRIESRPVGVQVDIRLNEFDETRCDLKFEAR